MSLVIANIYTMKYTGDLSFNFPNIPVFGNSLVYVFSWMGLNVVTVDEHYNLGGGPHDVDFDDVTSTGVTSPAIDTGGNGATAQVLWTQCVQATFTTVNFSAKDHGGSGGDVLTYLTIYEIEGAIGQTPGSPTELNSSPFLDWRSSNVTTADASLIALGDHMFLEPNTGDCFPCPTGGCGVNDRQAKFTLGANFATVIASVAIPGYDLFNTTDPCTNTYVQNDFICAVCSNGTADALTLTDNIQGTWVIDYQIDGQIFGHAVTPAAPGTGNIVVVKNTSLATSALKMFGFTSSWGSGFSLHDGQSIDSGPIATGTYSVAETAVAGWSSSAVVSSGDPINALNLIDGQTITVTFTNSPSIPTISTLAKVYPWVS